MLIPEITEILDQMTAWRRHLHRHPETAFEEYATADFIASKLTEWGIEVCQGIASTGVVGTLRHGADSPSSSAIGLRADMDALPIAEENEFEHRSLTPGKMHACGHDGHTAMLLGAAHYLAKTQRFRGTVHFIFQPAEENEGGGRRMVEEGLFARFPMRAVFGLHNIPGIPLGKFAVMPGPMMGSYDVMEMTIRGAGAHAAMPHTGVDPIVIAAHLVTMLQSVVSRSVDPMEPAVLSVTQINAGDTWNVIPERATIRGTVRALNPAVRDLIESRAREVSEHIAAAHRATVDLRYERRYPATVNSVAETQEVERVLELGFGAHNVLRSLKPILAAEDFGFMLQAKPGCYVWLGNGDGAGGCVLHNPRYDFNDRALGYGATYWALLVETLMPA